MASVDIEFLEAHKTVVDDIDIRLRSRGAVLVAVALWPLVFGLIMHLFARKLY